MTVHVASVATDSALSSAHPTLRRRTGRTYVAVTIYLVVFAVLLTVLSQFYLLPALKASRSATPSEQKKLAAGALLVLLIVLFALGAGLMLTFRIGRFFFPRTPPRGEPTKYVDAWAESGRRMQTPPPEPDEPHQ